MKTSRQYVVTGENLSYVWAAVFLEAWEAKGRDFAPLVVTITGLDETDTPQEHNDIRDALDDSLQSLGTQLTCGTVASTIFPDSLWNPRLSRNKLYARFGRIWPRVKRCPRNRLGHYFRRMTCFNSGLGDMRFPNQLEHIITTYCEEKNHRRSALQAVIFDPTHDHTNSRQQGFPCLHQVAFIPLGNKELGVTGFFGLQYLFERAYGNYLGLCRLGRFMAHGMGLKISRVTCVASAATLTGGKIPKKHLAPLVTAVQDMLPDDATVGVELT